MRQRSRWGLVGALSHAVFSGRLWKSPAGSGCALCGQHEHGEMFAVFYDREICRACVYQAVSFFESVTERPAPSSGAPTRRCVLCSGAEAADAPLYDASRGSICSTCAPMLVRAFSARCTR
jgi:hypothetical protein